jgi:GTPase SAR1 family protein
MVNGTHRCRQRDIHGRENTIVDRMTYSSLKNIVVNRMTCMVERTLLSNELVWWWIGGNQLRIYWSLYKDSRKQILSLPNLPIPTNSNTQMIENTEYQDIIDKINWIRSYGLSKMVTIPQIAILGDQSSGKSSVLEAITKLSFPRNIETCTRFATQVSLRRGDTPQMSASIDGESEFNDTYWAQNSNWDVHAVVTAANKILCANTEISEKVLEITISGPSLSPLTIIDLPGYINTTIDGQDKTIVQTIRTINTRYIKDSRTIILAVVPANIDLNNIFVLGEAERYDQNNERTIPIVTKPDTIEQDLLPNLIQTLLNKRKFMKLGYLVMRNSSYKDIDMPWDDARQLEEFFFKSSPMWSQVPDANKGHVR